MPAWSPVPHARDGYLRKFLPTEPLLVGPFYSTVAKYAAFGWRVTGPARTARIVHRILHSVDEGDGWLPFITKVLQDLLGQDNGAFIEVIRADDDPLSPVVMLNHLDAARCTRTGIRETPVIYRDIEGHDHALRYYQVITLSEFPSARETAYGVQICALSRVLGAAQYIRDLNIYKDEKISGKHVGAVHLVGGVSAKSVRDALRTHAQQSASEGFTHYLEPAVIASLDPNATVSKATLEMATLPDGFNAETEFKNYLITFANCFGTDLQDYMPLPGGNLGTSQQSEILHTKAQGKGPRLFMGILEHQFNFHGLMPDTVHFGYGEQDLMEDERKAALSKQRAERLRLLVGRGTDQPILPPEIARQLMEDEGDLSEDYLVAMGEENERDTVTLSSSIRVPI
jgi:hypothetical protein